MSQLRSAGHRRGFTIIEMMVVVLIVGILASAAMPLAALNKRRSQESELRESLRTIRRALDAYKRAFDEGKIEKKADASGYPPSLDVLVGGVPDITRPDGGKIYFLRRLPRDPFAEADLQAAQTWGTRSYDSPPEQPLPGQDVFDVHSLAEGTGMDGVPYQRW